MADVDKETEQKFMSTSVRLFYLSYLANLMNNEPGSKPEEAAKKSMLGGLSASENGRLIRRRSALTSVSPDPGR